MKLLVQLVILALGAMSLVAATEVSGRDGRGFGKGKGGHHLGRFGIGYGGGFGGGYGLGYGGGIGLGYGGYGGLGGYYSDPPENGYGYPGYYGGPLGYGY